MAKDVGIACRLLDTTLFGTSNAQMLDNAWELRIHPSLAYALSPREKKFRQLAVETWLSYTAGLAQAPEPFLRTPSSAPAYRRPQPKSRGLPLGALEATAVQAPAMQARARRIRAASCPAATNLAEANKE